MGTTKYYYTVTDTRSKLYYLTQKGQDKFKKLHPNFDTNDDAFRLGLEWLEKNAKFLSNVDCYAY